MRVGASGAGRRNIPTGLLLHSGATRFIALALLWLVLTEGDLGTLWLGALAVVVATLASLVLLPPAGHAWSPTGAAIFAGFFLWQSLVGGIDVARRALRPNMDLEPALIEYKTRLPEGGARVLFANTISLLPGTLSAEIQDRRLLVHALAVTPGLREELRRTEKVVARFFGVDLPQDDTVVGDANE